MLYIHERDIFLYFLFILQHEINRDGFKKCDEEEINFPFLYQNNILLICGRTESFCGRTHWLSVVLTSFEIPKNGSQEKIDTVIRFSGI